MFGEDGKSHQKPSKGPPPAASSPTPPQPGLFRVGGLSLSPPPTTSQLPAAPQSPRQGLTGLVLAPLSVPPSAAPRLSTVQQGLAAQFGRRVSFAPSPPGGSSPRSVVSPRPNRATTQTEAAPSPPITILTPPGSPTAARRREHALTADVQKQAIEAVTLAISNIVSQKKFLDGHAASGFTASMSIGSDYIALGAGHISIGSKHLQECCRSALTHVSSLGSPISQDSDIDAVARNAGTIQEILIAMEKSLTAYTTQIQDILSHAILDAYNSISRGYKAIKNMHDVLQDFQARDVTKEIAGPLKIVHEACSHFVRIHACCRLISDETAAKLREAALGLIKMRLLSYRFCPSEPFDANADARQIADDLRSIKIKPEDLLSLREQGNSSLNQKLADITGHLSTPAVSTPNEPTLDTPAEPTPSASTGHGTAGAGAQASTFTQSTDERKSTPITPVSNKKCVDTFVGGAEDDSVSSLIAWYRNTFNREPPQELIDLLNSPHGTSRPTIEWASKAPIEPEVPDSYSARVSVENVPEALVAYRESNSLDYSNRVPELIERAGASGIFMAGVALAAGAVQIHNC